MFLLSRRVAWYIFWPWKVMLKIWPQVKVMTWPEKIMFHISRSASSAWTHLWCFHRSSWSLSKVILEKLMVTFHDLKWPWWRRGVIGHNISTQGVNSTSNPMFESVLNVFCSKEAHFIFLLLTYIIMERSQNWPDLRSPISKFWDIYFIDTVACSNRWKFQGNRSVGIALTNIQTFY